MIYVSQPHTEEWFAARKTGIGASQAAAACGVSPWSTPLKVYLQRRGEIPPDPDNEHTRFGRHMEPGIVAMYCEEFETTVTYPMAMYRHDRYPFMLATGDAQESPEVGVEIKTMDPRRPGAQNIDALGLDEVCPEYLVQCQQQMAVMDWDCVKLVMLIGKTLRVFEIDRDADMIQLIVDCEAALWEKIQAGIRPEATSPLDLKYLRQRKKIAGHVVPLSDASARIWERAEWCSRLMKQLESRRDALKASVLSEIGDAPGGLLPDGEYMIARSLIRKKGYSVAPSESLDVRKKKYDGSPLAVSQTLPAAS